MTDALDPFDPAEWGDKPGCSAFETALDMRAKGVLASSATPVLEAHLAACDSCRDYGARSRRVDALFAAASSGPTSPDWLSLHQRLLDRLKETRRTPVLIGGSMLGVLFLWAGLSVFFTEKLPPVWVLVLTFVSAGLAAGYGLYLRGRRLRRLLAETDVIVAYRRWLEWSLKMSRRMNLWMPIYLLMVQLPVARSYRRLAHGDRRAGAPVILMAVAVALMVATLIFQNRAARRMKRELTELH
jgi:hypothetical protein